MPMTWPHLSVSGTLPLTNDDGITVETTAAIIVDEGDLNTYGDLFRCRVVLTLNQGYAAPLYKFPGGHPERGETSLLEVIERECKEEIGYSPKFSDASLYYDVVKTVRRRECATRFYLVCSAVDQAHSLGEENGAQLLVVKHYTLGDVWQNGTDRILLNTHRRGLEGCLDKLKEQHAKQCRG